MRRKKDILHSFGHRRFGLLLRFPGIEWPFLGLRNCDEERETE